MDENTALTPVTGTDEKAQQTNMNKAAPQRAEKRGGGAFVLTILMLIVILAGGAYFLFDEMRALRIQYDELRALYQQRETATAQKIEQLQRDTQELRSLQEQQTETLNSLSLTHRRTDLDWALAEIEYLLLIAGRRLSLEGDAKTALAALTAADQRLVALNAPGLLRVRQQIAMEVNQLQSLQHADAPGMAIYLAELIERVDELPLKLDGKRRQYQREREQPEQQQSSRRHSESAPPEQSLWRSLPQRLWAEIKDLVVIKRTGETPEILLISTEEEYFLYQNLKLQLENARLSILRSDPDNLRATLALAESWLHRYFDAGDSAVNDALARLAQMRGVKLRPQLPEPGAALEYLRAYMRDLEPAG